jgi:hypothetical protein
VAQRLAIHIGAQKCASSSLQASLRLFQNSCNNKSFSFVCLNPAQLRSTSNALTHKIESPFQYIDQILSELKSDFSVLSHEMLGNRPALVQAIARRALKHHGFEHVVVVGYTRLQSSYHISAFKQWFFRDRKKLRNDIAVVKDYDLPWRKFSALERSLLAMTLTGKDRSWHANYKKLTAGSHALSSQMTIASNHIPTKQRSYLLLEDFFQLSGFDCEDDLSVFDVRKNVSFHPAVVHALSSHFSSLGSSKSCFPGPHEGNRWLFRVCNRLDHASVKLPAEDSVFLNEFCGSIVHYLDRRNYPANLEYCRLMSVNKSCFEPESVLHSLPRLNDLVQVAQETAKHRSQKDIDDFLLMSENAFMNSSRAEIIST